jgi:protein-disulfide isomerase-like protein with CxxC motif
VAEGTGAQFGEPFLRSLQAGRLRVDATRAAAAMIALLATEALPVSTVLHAVQHEFFVNGRPLEDAGVLGEVSTALGLDGPAVELFAATERARTLAGEDFELARDLDRTGGPLLLASRGERIFEFDGLGASGEQLVDQFRTVLAKP